MGLNKKLRSIEYQQQRFAELVDEDLRRILERIDQKKKDGVKNENELPKDLPEVEQKQV
jgi:hypothetical protein